MPGVVGFAEAFVRPVLPVNVRPTPSREVALDADDRVVTIASKSGKVIKYDFTFSYAFSKSKLTEAARKFDVVRVKNPTDASQFVDAEVMTALRARDSNGGTTSRQYAPQQARPNIEILSRNNIRNS